MSIDTESLRANTDIAEVIGRYLALTQAGSEFKGLCPFHDDHNPSFTVSPAKHFYHCFACGAHGDIISFIQEFEKVDFKTACEKLGAKDFTTAMRPTVSHGTTVQPEPEWTPIIPSPADAPQLFPKEGHTCRIYNPKRAGTDKEWTEFTISRQDWYRTADDKLAGCVLRVDFEDGGKFTPTITFCTNAAGERRWAMVTFPKPRLLQCLDQLRAHPDKPVMLVEGEKAREAAQVLFPSYIATTWPGGVNGVDSADWTPLAGRDVVIWPDADEAGRRAVVGYKAGSNGHGTYHQGIADILRPLAKRLRWIDATGQPDGWDAADALADALQAHWTPQQATRQATRWAKAAVGEIPAYSEAVAIQAIATPPAPAPRPTRPVPAPPAVTSPAPASNVVPIESARSKALPQSASGLWEHLHLETNGNGIPHTNLANVTQAITAHPDTAGHIWFDEFYGGYFTDWEGARREWSDADDRRLTIWVQSALALHKVGDDLAHKAIQAVGDAHTRNEPKDWMKGLIWDGTERICSSLCTYFGVKDAAYSRAIAKNFWLSMVARVFEPGCKVDNMIVLEAAQGARKSSALNIIGGQWYCEAHESVMFRDFFIALRGKLVVEIGELDSFSRAENTKVKQVITCRSDRYRDLYSRTAADHPRQNIFVGTTNDDNYLRDITGGRRFWPARCTDIHVDDLQRDREQLFAEAVKLYRDEVSWWQVPKDEAEKQQEFRRDSDEWEDFLNEWLSGRDETTVKTVAEAIGIDLDELDKRTQMRLANCLKIIGFERRTMRINGKLQKTWIRKPVKPAG